MLSLSTKIWCKAQKQVHSDERRFSCEQCGKSFKRPYHLKVHLVHNTERTYKCSICEEGLKLFRHNDQKRYCCSKCEKKFTFSGQLSSHIAMPMHWHTLCRKALWLFSMWANANVANHVPSKKKSLIIGLEKSSKKKIMDILWSGWP